LATVYLAALRSIQRVVISFVAESSALILNVFLNACFIFGFLGFPLLGIRGIGYATSVSRFAVFILCVVVSSCSKDIRFNLKYVFRKVPTLTGDFFSMAVPATGNEVGWALGVSMYALVFGHLGSDAVAANSLVTVIRNLAASFCWGIGGASGIITGEYLGAGKIEEGRSVAKTMLKMAVLTGMGGGLLILASTPLVLSIANISPVAKDYLTFMLKVNSVHILGTAVNATLISGILRSGGDAKWGFKCDMIGMWLYGVPLSFLAAFVFKLPVKIVFLLMSTDEFVKWPAVLRRFRSGRWAKNITRVIE
jgi:Na+-driven multidrug efflux pump